MTNKIKPNHYQTKRGKDLIDCWYEKYSLTEFRAIMKSHIEKYIARYDQKNGVEDLKKAQEFIRRLISKEELGTMSYSEYINEGD